MTEALTTGTDINTDESAKVTLKQKVEDWQDPTMQENINSIANFVVYGKPSPGGTAWVTYAYEDDRVELHYSGGTAESDPTPIADGGTTNPTAANEQTANNIGNSIIALMSQKGSPNNTKVTISVRSDGSFSVGISGNNGNGNNNSNKDFKITEEDVRASLSSYITNGKIHFEENDANYPNGYKVVINKNNGNGGKITIEGL